MTNFGFPNFNDTPESLLHRLNAYSEVYFLVGLFESALRNAIPITLRDFSFEQGHQTWWGCLPLTPKGEKSLGTALIRAKKLSKSVNNIQPDEDLPLSFWRYLVRRGTYGSLWVPVLYQAFPNLKQGKRHSSFRELDARFERALITRNRIAHYERRWKIDARYEIENLLWLVNSINLELHVAGKYAFDNKLRSDLSGEF